MSLSVFELPLIGLPVLVHHHPITYIVILKSPLESSSLSEPVQTVQFLVVLPLPPELIAIGVPISTVAAPLTVFYFALVVLLL